MKANGVFTAEIIPLKGDGSERRFFRIKKGSKSLILILPQGGPLGLKEAKAYYEIGSFLRRAGLPVPEIYAYEPQTGLLLVEDLGDTRLYDLKAPLKENFYPQALEIWASFAKLAPLFPKECVLEGPFYDARLMWEKEALYFLNSFLKDYCGFKGVALGEAPLLALWEKLKGFAKPNALLHRDFQSKNLMVKEGTLYLIDFQGMRLGPAAYDLASLLLDPYVALPQKTQENLLKQAQRLFPLEEEAFWALALFRNFQVLGAFAKLTLAGKRWFAAYIPQALKSLKRLLKRFPPEGPALMKLLGSVFEQFGL